MSDSQTFKQFLILKASSEVVFSIDLFCLTFNHKQHRWDWGICLKPSKKVQVLFPDLTALSVLVGPGIEQHMFILLVCHSFSLKAGYAGEGMKRTVFCSAFTCNSSSCFSLCLLPFFNSLQPSQLPFPTVC